MNDRIPGSSWSNPIWYRKYRIYLSDAPYPQTEYAYAHDDYDGADDAHDIRHGYASSIEEAKKDIDEIEAE